RVASPTIACTVVSRCSRSCWAAASARVASRPATATRAPSAASTFAVARPMPAVPPTIRYPRSRTPRSMAIAASWALLHPLQQVVAEGGGRLGVASQSLELGTGAYRSAGTPDVHGPVHDALVDLGQIARHAGHALGQPEHLGIELVGGKGAVGEALGDGLDAGDGITEQHHLHGPAHAEEHRVVLPVGRRDDAHDRVADLGVLGHVDEVA